MSFLTGCIHEFLFDLRCPPSSACWSSSHAPAADSSPASACWPSCQMYFPFSFSSFRSRVRSTRSPLHFASRSFPSLSEDSPGRLALVCLCFSFVLLPFFSAHFSPPLLSRFCCFSLLRTHADLVLVSLFGLWSLVLLSFSTPRTPLPFPFPLTSLLPLWRAIWAVLVVLS